MPRHYSYSHLVSELAREARRKERELLKEEQEDERERLKEEREQQREAQRFYVENRLEEVDKKNKELACTNKKLIEILEDALSTENNIQFDSLRNHVKFREFDSPTQPIEPKKESFIPKKPNFLAKLLPGWQRRYQAAIQKGEARYQASYKNYQGIITEHNARTNRLREEYEKEKTTFESKIQEHNQEIDQFENAYRGGEPKAIIAYCSLVLILQRKVESGKHQNLIYRLI